VPVEAYNLVKIVERYYGPLYCIYHIIIAELLDIDKDMALQIAFKAINDSIDPNSLIPTLLVFRAYPRIVKSDVPNPIVVKRAAALKKAIKEVKKLRAECQVVNALNMCNRPKTTAIYNLPLNSPILVWRERLIGQPGYWSGPYNLLSIKNETCTI
jgi:hypothetical protein